jgi:predicted nucleotidyltransferase
MEFGRFLDLVRAFEREGVEYVLVGGVAVNLHGLARTTEDVDLFVRPAPGNIARVRRALRSLWDDAEVDAIRPEDFEAYPTLRYGPPDEDFVVDLITRIGTAFRYEDLEAEAQVIDGVRVVVATPATLVRMKERTVRPIDKSDADALRRMFGLEGR